MQNKFARTDLAAEAVGRLDRAPEGVFADTLSLHGCEVSRVVISSEAGAEALGKPMGKYLTLEMADYVTRRGQSFPDCAAALRDLLKSFEAVERAQSYLIACLGNRAVTPDAVGPLTADGIIVTRHLKSSLPQDFAAFSSSVTMFCRAAPSEVSMATMYSFSTRIKYDKGPRIPRSLPALRSQAARCAGFAAAFSFATREFPPAAASATTAPR